MALSLREAARRSNHAAAALRRAIKDGELHPDEQGKISEAELERFIASLGTCRYFDCDKPARYPSLCCSRSHAVAEAKRTTEPRECAHPDCARVFRPRPEQLREGWGECCSRKCAQVLRRMREESAGKLRGERIACACGCGESRLVFPSQRTAPPDAPAGYVAPYMYLNAKHWAQHRWRHGIALTNNVRGFYRAGRWSLPKLRQVLGRWSGKKGGGRPSLASTDPAFAETVAEVERLREAHPAWGARTIARAVGLSHWKVREILASRGAS